MKTKSLFKDTFRLQNIMVSSSFGELCGQSFEVWELQRKIRPFSPASRFSVEFLKYAGNGGWLTQCFFFYEEQAYKNLTVANDYKPCVIGVEFEYQLSPMLIFPKEQVLYNMDNTSALQSDLSINYVVHHRSGFHQFDQRFVYDNLDDALNKMDEINSFVQIIITK